MTAFIRWTDPNPAPSPVVGFHAHYSDDCATWVTPLALGMPVPVGDVYSATIPLPAQTTCVSLTATDGTLTSQFSNYRDLPEAGGVLMLLSGLLLLAALSRSSR
jgi:hypothetical protein